MIVRGLYKAAKKIGLRETQRSVLQYVSSVSQEDGLLQPLKKVSAMRRG
ncbi:hypothetical protein ABENE_03570 [Asticcacaulis benevestitus DSM 16100 = ATCC BAA-896]|uniref:Uncharacterized protein n=1 Tax=Asticcacaulis benevestitus DSM 16100 = ATCC BAA-896 TaxID=1121022 RepID=V4RSN8_9CAUL|nr:hypothetical protein ABENE_03570 [Asticcacaulis benevestitus DSM 16100 = ATCC BAA-896]